ncbi:autotransporter assembly complex protein TamA [Sphingomicrobium lutaoense]|uniref:Translocation and assembly module TamA n=1 Tax=Sphingomicrobium lutaoense TaxID=515949 RepID=A0A839YW12_9SPHN|nr:BamA/TamA family outer membrane protein [Sphingomicrobium lutaoense]MBB3763389.1 translocation and assembly module TamA [Sphingomicrobium lutaoense]
MSHTPAHLALLAACGVVAVAAPAYAQDGATPGNEQEAPLPPVDVDSPLDPLPGLDLEWPELDSDPPLSDTPAALTDVADEIRYEVRLTGLPEGRKDEIETAFEAQSALEAGDGEAVNAVQVDRRARADRELLQELLRSVGYYDAEVRPDIRPREGAPLAVTLDAEPGALYRFQSVELPGLEAAGEAAPRLREAFAVKAGDPVDAQAVIDAGAALDLALGEEGFARARIGEQQVVIDHERRTATLVLPVTPGPASQFGQIRVEGRPPFPASHVADIARFDPGDPYRRSLVQDLRRALVATGLVASVNIEPEASDDGEVIDLVVTLQPAPPRTIAGAVGYNTGEGFRIEGSWEHRNLINPEGAFTARAVLGTQEQLAALGMRFGNWRRRDQSLSLSALAGSIDRPAYNADTVVLTAGVERSSNFIWQKPWTYSAGVELIASDETDRIVLEPPPGMTDPEIISRRETFFIGALPLRLHYDGSDDLLDPGKGFRLGGWVSPEVSLDGSTRTYLRAQIDGSLYQPVGEKMILAGRARVGSIFGAGLDDIAPSRRFYGGGGGSVRGFEYQAIGPRDPFFNDPSGGRSLTEVALEVRYRLNESWGVVPFIDAGRVSRDPWPGHRDFRFGAGIGVRYYTSFGPIRIDVGTPLNPREGDAAVAVAVSLGQAF